MKAALFSLTIGASIARTVQALSDVNGAITVTSILPVITLSNCPPSGTESSGRASATPAVVSNVGTYTTALTQPYSGGFIQMTYTVVGQPTGIPSGFTTGLAVVNSRTQVITYPSASASEYMQSGYLAPSNGGSDSSQNANPSNPSGNLIPTSAQISAVHSSEPTASGGANGVIGSSNNSGSPSTHATGSSNSTVPASKSSMAVYTGGANAGSFVDGIGGSMLAALVAVAALI